MRKSLTEQVASRIACNILQEALGPLEQDARPENTTWSNWSNTIPDTRRPGVWNVAAQDAYNALIAAGGGEEQTGIPEPQTMKDKIELFYAFQEWQRGWQERLQALDPRWDV